MPTISSKGKLMPASPIRKLTPLARKAEKKNIKVYHLNIGQPDIKTPQIALDAVKNNDIEILSYGQSEGTDGYRSKLANYYHKQHIEVEKEDIIVTTGGSEALLFALNTIADPGDEIIVPEPFYANYTAFAVGSGLKVVPVICSIENGFALPDISEFEKLINKKTKAIIICNPGNPTGYLYSKGEIEKLAEIVKKNDLFLISDEVYREFVYDDDIQHHSILHDFGLENHAIMIDSVSKRYSMCGARIGCLVSKNKDVINTVLKFAQSRLSPPTYAQIASEAALDTPLEYFKEINAEYKERRDTLINELQKIDGVIVSIPKGAFYCLVQLPIPDSENFAVWMLDEFEDNKETIMVAPAAGFYSTPGKGENQIRIAYVLNKESLIRSVEILKIALEKYKNR